jgi:hypothetical protein
MSDESQEVISTTKVCALVGVMLTATFIKDELNIEPLYSTETAYFFKKADVPTICLRLSAYMAAKALFLQRAS